MNNIVKEFEKVNNLNILFADLSLERALQTITQEAGKISFSSSLGPEDQVITDAIFRQNLPISIFSLDTGRLFSESYELLDKTVRKYKKNIDIYYPKHDLLEDYVSKQGINAFYNSIDKRKECCYIRKIEPLNRALANTQIWITGIRAGQSGYRADMDFFEWDHERALIKFNPLLNWSTNNIWHYINEHDVPYNSLHKKGFPSIGCQPCTRAIGLHEDERAGRWWWEDADKKECGLHGKSRVKSV